MEPPVDPPVEPPVNPPVDATSPVETKETAAEHAEGDEEAKVPPVSSPAPATSPARAAPTLASATGQINSTPKVIKVDSEINSTSAAAADLHTIPLMPDVQRSPTIASLDHGFVRTATPPSPSVSQPIPPMPSGDDTDNQIPGLVPMMLLSVLSPSDMSSSSGGGGGGGVVVTAQAAAPAGTSSSDSAAKIESVGAAGVSTSVSSDESVFSSDPASGQAALPEGNASAGTVAAGRSDSHISDAKAQPSSAGSNETKTSTLAEPAAVLPSLDAFHRPEMEEAPVDSGEAER